MTQLHLGILRSATVLQAFVRETDVLGDLYVDGEVISTTEEHPFWVVDKGWVEADDLRVGDLLTTEDGVIIDIDWIGNREGNFEVYNFEFEDFHTSFVSDREILIHNACPTIYNQFNDAGSGLQNSRYIEYITIGYEKNSSKKTFLCSQNLDFVVDFNGNGVLKKKHQSLDWIGNKLYIHNSKFNPTRYVN